MYVLLIKNPFLGRRFFVFSFSRGVRYTIPQGLSLDPSLGLIFGSIGHGEKQATHTAYTSNSYSLPTVGLNWTTTEARGSPGPSHQEWDKDKDGRLDYREFAAIFQYLGRCSQDAMWCDVMSRKHLADAWI